MPVNAAAAAAAAAAGSSRSGSGGGVADGGSTSFHEPTLAHMFVVAPDLPGAALALIPPAKSKDRARHLYNTLAVRENHKMLKL